MAGKVNQDLIQVTEGPTGPEGIAGDIANTLSIEVTIAFAITSPFYTPSYVYTAVKGDIWKSTGDFTYTLDANLMAITLTTFLLAPSKNFDVYIERADLRLIGGGIIPAPIPQVLDVAVFEKDDDKIRFGIIKDGYGRGNPIPDSSLVATLGNGYNIESMKIGLLIIGAD